MRIWQRDFDQAVFVGSRGVKLHPHLQTVRVNYAQALQLSGHLEAALAQYQIASIIAPDVPWLRALEGSVELVDALFAFFANTISFVRIAAFAAVHAATFVALFAVSDTLAGLSAGKSLSIVALVVGNIVLVLLEGLTVSVQVLRLEYYEFFGKFFRGGGEQYRPLMLRSNKQGGIT